MKKNLFEIFQKNAQKFFNLTSKEKFHYSYLLYNEIKKILKKIDYQSIGFVLPNNDHFYIFAVIEDLIKENKNVLNYEENQSNFAFNKITSIYDDSSIINGIRQYKAKKYFNKIPEIIVVPIYFWKNKQGATFSKKNNLFLSQLNSKKIGYCLYECETNFDKINEVKPITFDWLILI